MKILIILGMPAAGKDIACRWARTNQYPYFSTGDIVRNELKKRNIKRDPQMTAQISTELRGEDGLGVTRTAVAEALKTKATLVFLEGIRSWPEIELVRSHAPCWVIAFVAPRDLRLMRIKQRGRDDDSADHFNERDWREIHYGVAACIALADDYVLNTGTEDDAFHQLDAVIKKFVASTD
jgi:dephospho-CoA kinase